MSISSTVRKAGPFTGNAITTAFPFAYKVFQASDVLVVQTDLSGVQTTKTLTTDYTVALNANQDSNPGGTVNMIVAPPTGFLLTLGSQVPQTQGMVLTNTGGFFPNVLNDAADRATILIQQMNEQLNRAVYIPFSSTASTALPTPSANSLLGWNSSGNAITNIPLSSVATVVSAAMLPVVTAVDLPTARTAMGMGAASAVQFSTVTATSGFISTGTSNFSTAGATAIITNTNDTANHITMQTAGASKWVQYLSGGKLAFFDSTNSTDRVQITTTGMVIAGTLNVSGNVAFATGNIQGPTNEFRMFANAGGVLTLGANSQAGYVTVGAGSVAITDLSTFTVSIASGGASTANIGGTVGTTTTNLQNNGATVITLTTAGAKIAGQFACNGVALAAAPTGYGAPTGGVRQGSFAAGSITLPNLAAGVAQLILDLKATGLIAA